MTESSVKQLVIIGNGFDLRCGLPSTYADFHLDREQYFSQGESGCAECVHRHTRTIWDTILSKSAQKGWTDIEGTIEEWISDPKAKPGHRHGAEEVAFCMCQNNPMGFVPDSAVAERASVEQLRRKYGSLSCGRRQVFSYFLNELHVLENDFRSYLMRKVGECEGYGDRANALLFSILGDGGLFKDEAAGGYAVLSFNYTRAAENYGVGTPEGRKPIWYSNIHGRLNDEIIFGIDATNRLEDSDVAQFTKTYRVLGLRSRGRHNGSSGDGLGISPQTSAIKFFGHSLGNADHSYFQSMFDIVRLYEGTTRLIFYYCPYRKPGGEEVSEPQARNEMMAKALKLLSDYGTTLDNKDHGKNLVHKLMLEDRVEVRLLPEIEWKAQR